MTGYRHKDAIRIFWINRQLRDLLTIAQSEMRPCFFRRQSIYKRHHRLKDPADAILRRCRYKRHSDLMARLRSRADRCRRLLIEDWLPSSGRNQSNLKTPPFTGAI